MGAGDTALRERLVRDLETAVPRGQIVAMYQPQIEVASGDIVAVESLTRWEHPEFGLLPPSEFIPLAEDTGTIHELGRFMIEDGCRLAAEWDAKGLPIDVSVNVSAKQLVGYQFFDALGETIQRSAIKPDRFTIEITESQAIEDLPTVARQLDRVRDFGVGISIDDFGIGHSTIDQLMGLPVTELKIDKSVVHESTTVGGRILAAVVGLVHHKGLRVVAEGIETPEQLERVRRYGCDRAQGFLIAHPMPQREVEHFISRHRSGHH